MIEYYPQIKWLHIACVIASGGLFALRGLMIQFGGSRWAMAAPVRYLSYAIDTMLLAAALMLVTMLHQYPFVQAWLTVKILLLLVYIVLGTYALKRAPTLQRKLLCFIAALLVYAFIASVALTHSPYGVFAE